VAESASFPRSDFFSRSLILPVYKSPNPGSVGVHLAVFLAYSMQVIIITYLLRILVLIYLVLLIYYGFYLLCWFRANNSIVEERFNTEIAKKQNWDGFAMFLAVHFFTFHFSLLTLHFSLLTLHFSLLTIHFSLLTIHFSLLTIHFSLLTLHFSLLTLHFSLLTLHFSLLTLHFSLLTLHFSLLTLLPIYFLLRPTLRTQNKVLLLIYRGYKRCVSCATYFVTKLPFHGLDCWNLSRM
jgi:hypothetical protein